MHYSGAQELIEELKADDQDGSNDEEQDHVEMDDSGIEEEEDEDLDDVEMEEEEEDPADDDDSDYESINESDDEDGQKVSLIEGHSDCEDEDTKEPLKMVVLDPASVNLRKTSPLLKRPKRIKNTIWECQVCGRECTARRTETFQEHLALHAIQMQCVVKGCAHISPRMATLRTHLKCKHKKNVCELSELESERFKEQRNAFWYKTKFLVRVFFPETAFLRYAGRPRSGAAMKCKKCGESVAARIPHVLSHIKVRSECPIGGCNRVFAGLKELLKHLEKDHKTNLTKMSESEVKKFIDGQTRVNEAVKSVFHQYFDH